MSNIFNYDTLCIIYEYINLEEKLNHVRTSKMFRNVILANHNTMQIYMGSKGCSLRTIADNSEKFLLNACKTDNVDFFDYVTKKIFIERELTRKIIFTSHFFKSNKIIEHLPKENNFSTLEFGILLIQINKKQDNICNKDIIQQKYNLLECAVLLDDVEMLKYVCDVGKIQPYDLRVLHYLIKNIFSWCSSKIIKCLREKQIVTDQKLFEMACTNNFLDVAKWIYKFGNCVVSSETIAKTSPNPVTMIWMLSKIKNSLSYLLFGFFINLFLMLFLTCAIIFNAYCNLIAFAFVANFIFLLFTKLKWLYEKNHLCFTILLLWLIQKNTSFFTCFLSALFLWKAYRASVNKAKFSEDSIFYVDLLKKYSTSKKLMR